jgi:hypothetical protein
MIVDFKKLYRLALPTFLRKPLILAFVLPIYKCLNGIYIVFKKYVSAKTYDLEVTPQVWSLEKMLNDRFCNGKHHINITEAEPKPVPFFYRVPDSKDEHFFDTTAQIHFFEIASIGYDDTFIVNVPSEYEPHEDEIKALLNKYKLVSKTFKINYKYG